MHEIRLQPFTRRRFMAPLVLLGSQSTLSAVPRYAVFVAGVDRTTSYIAPNIRITQQIASRSTASFTVRDLIGSYRPNVDDEVLIIEKDTGRKLFSGFVERTATMGMVPENANEPAWSIEVSCTDHGVIADRRIVGRYYTEFMGGLLGIIIGDAINKFMTGTGITLVWTIAASTYIGPKGFNYIPFSEVCNELARIAGCNWRIDFDRNLRFFTKTDGYGTAPESFTDSSANWKTIRITRTRAQFANRIYAKTDRNLGATWTDNAVGDGNTHIYATTYHQDVKPQITVNGVAQLVVTLAEISEPHDFYYIPGGVGVFYNLGRAPLTPSDTIVITYPSPLPYVAIAEDATSIATHGLFERTVEVQGVDSRDQLQAFADGELVRSKERPLEIEVETLSSGFEAGQRVTVNVTHPETINDTFLLESVSSAEEGQVQFRHMLKLSSLEIQRTASSDKLVGELIARSRVGQSRIVQKVRFDLALTIEGDTNPGLSVGEKNPIVEAYQDGVAGWVALFFKSISDGTPTTEDIEIDIFQNGVSMFDPASRPILPAGAVSPTQHWVFLTDPLAVEKGDLFTIEIISADSAAKDGYADLVILG